jgi:hypothetical protein
MPDAPPNPELLRSLGQLVRGLSALFWGLPLALIICVETVRAGWFRNFNIVPPLIVTGLLYYGLWMLGDFQKQERPWRRTLDAAKILALVNCGLSPFLYWLSRVPGNSFLEIVVGLLMLTSLLFLFGLNSVLLRLGEMLPDETLRHETRLFTAVNRSLLLALLGLVAANVVLSQIPKLPVQILMPMAWLNNNPLVILFVLIFLGLVPLAMTMALIWKTKEVIFDSVFAGK